MPSSPGPLLAHPWDQRHSTGRGSRQPKGSLTATGITRPLETGQCRPAAGPAELAGHDGLASTDVSR